MLCSEDRRYARWLADQVRRMACRPDQQHPANHRNLADWLDDLAARGGASNGALGQLAKMVRDAAEAEPWQALSAEELERLADGIAAAARLPETVQEGAA